MKTGDFCRFEIRKNTSTQCDKINILHNNRHIYLKKGTICVSTGIIFISIHSVITLNTLLTIHNSLWTIIHVLIYANKVLSFILNLEISFTDKKNRSLF